MEKKFLLLVVYLENYFSQVTRVINKFQKSGLALPEDDVV